MFTKIFRKHEPKSPLPAVAPQPALWLDAEDAVLRANATIQDAGLRTHALNMIKDGFTVLRGLSTAGLCDRVVEDYYKFCQEEHAEKRHKKSRVVNFHIYSEAARTMLLDPDLMTLLDVLFGRESALWTSLTFEYGTEQRRHRDSPHFDTRPPGLYFGVWTALEDISPESGPLEFLPGGHRIASSIDVVEMAKDYQRVKDPNDPVNYGYLLENFFEDMDQQCEKAGLTPRCIEMKKGEKLIWHPWMPHGGSPALNPELTRRSLVGHYIPVGVPVFHCDVFFGIVTPNLSETYSYLEHARRRYVSYPRADFQTTYV